MFSNKPGRKSEKALGAMPEGPFLVGKYYDLDCAEFENVRCLSIRSKIVKLFFLTVKCLKNQVKLQY